MATAPRSVRLARQPSPHNVATGFDRLLLAAPVAAILAGCAAEWLDFRALRWPLLALVLAGVTLTSYALLRARDGWSRLLVPVAVGFATWTSAEILYVVLHTVQGESFSAERFGPQPMQALALIAAHGLLLGLPTGLVAALILRLAPSPRR
jgi:hypothetical protein